MNGLVDLIDYIGSENVCFVFQRKHSDSGSSSSDAPEVATPSDSKKKKKKKKSKKAEEDVSIGDSSFICCVTEILLKLFCL